MHCYPVAQAAFTTLCLCYNKAEKRYQKVNNIFYSITSAYSSLKDQIAFPKCIHIACTWMGYYGTIDLLFAGPRLVSNLTGIIREDSIYCRMNAGIAAASEVLGGISQVSFVLDTLKEIGIVARRAFALTTIASYVHLPLNSIYLVQSVQQVNQLSIFNKEIRYRSDMKSALQYAAAEGHHLQSSLYLSKKAKISETAKAILNRLEVDANEGEKEGEKFLSALSSKIFTRLVLDRTYACINLATVILMVTPMHPIATLTSTISNIVSIALSIIDNKLVLKLG